MQKVRTVHGGTIKCTCELHAWKINIATKREHFNMPGAHVHCSIVRSARKIACYYFEQALLLIVDSCRNEKGKENQFFNITDRSIGWIDSTVSQVELSCDWARVGLSSVGALGDFIAFFRLHLFLCSRASTALGRRFRGWHVHSEVKNQYLSIADVGEKLSILHNPLEKANLHKHIQHISV
ncbi:hypothetical protein Tsp_02001 [Trichinella spiralis]|uniref:hypothetical protein n=1 Tax=Trichinella spiralis TaxID=6334 RepID=UPI0001EFBAC0|nr:hypothetical protein Tsp_02001 [Trichinella spiralis]